MCTYRIALTPQVLFTTFFTEVSWTQFLFTPGQHIRSILCGIWAVNTHKRTVSLAPSWTAHGATRKAGGTDRQSSDAGRRPGWGRWRQSSCFWVWLDPLELLLCILTVCCAAVIYKRSEVLGKDSTSCCDVCLNRYTEIHGGVSAAESSAASWLPSFYGCFAESYQCFQSDLHSPVKAEHWDPVRPGASKRGFCSEVKQSCWLVGPSSRWWTDAGVCRIFVQPANTQHQWPPTLVLSSQYGWQMWGNGTATQSGRGQRWKVSWCTNSPSSIAG